MKYKVYDVGESIQIDIHSPGRDEKIEEYVLPKNTLDMFMLLKNTIDDEVMRLHSIIRKDNEYTWFPIIEVAKLFAGIFVTIIPAIAILKAGTNGALYGIINAVSSDCLLYTSPSPRD